MESTKFAIAKGITKIVVEVSVGWVVGTAIKNNCPTVSTSDRVKLMIGAGAIGGLVSAHAATYVSQRMDDIAEKVKNLYFTVEEKSPTE